MTEFFRHVGANMTCRRATSVWRSGVRISLCPIQAPGKRIHRSVTVEGLLGAGPCTDAKRRDTAQFISRRKCSKRAETIEGKLCTVSSAGTPPNLRVESCRVSRLAHHHVRFKRLHLRQNGITEEKLGLYPMRVKVSRTTARGAPPPRKN